MTDRNVIELILLASKRLDQVRRKMVRRSGVTVAEVEILGCFNIKTYTSFSEANALLLLAPTLLSRRMQKLRRAGLILIGGPETGQHFNSKTAKLTANGSLVYIQVMDCFDALEAKLLAALTTDAKVASIRVTQHLVREISSYLRPSLKDIEKQYGTTSTTRQP